MKNIVIGFSENIEFYDTYMHTPLCLSFTYICQKVVCSPGFVRVSARTQEISNVTIREYLG
jgi:hypothetical protein